MTKKPKLTRKQKCELATSKGFLYNENTGGITTPTGKIASKKNTKGYILLTLRDKLQNDYYLYGHQFAWFVKYNETIELIDHINRINWDNRIINLRDSNSSKNAMNRSNVKGVSFSKRSNRWVAKIMVNYKDIYLGSFINKDDALNCYKVNKEKYHNQNN